MPTLPLVSRKARANFRLQDGTGNTHEPPNFSLRWAFGGAEGSGVIQRAVSYRPGILQPLRCPAFGPNGPRYAASVETQLPIFRERLAAAPLTEASQPSRRSRCRPAPRRGCCSGEARDKGESAAGGERAAPDSLLEPWCPGPSEGPETPVQFASIPEPPSKVPGGGTPACPKPAGPRSSLLRSAGSCGRLRRAAGPREGRDDPCWPEPRRLSLQTPSRPVPCPQHPNLGGACGRHFQEQPEPEALPALRKPKLSSRCLPLQGHGISTVAVGPPTGVLGTGAPTWEFESLCHPLEPTTGAKKPGCHETKHGATFSSNQPIAGGRFLLFKPKCLLGT